MKTKLLLCKNVDKLGIVGDVVEVSPGYARNYLVPRHLATEPTEGNMRALAEARRIAEQERLRQRERIEELCAKLESAEVTIHARANEDGVLYGSVGRKEIAAALDAEGYPISDEQVALPAPLRHLDNVSVDLKLGDGLTSTVKVWVVREKVEGEEDTEPTGTRQETPEATTGTEAGTHDDRADE